MANTEGAAFDIAVIGGGPGGYATALYGAAAGLSVAIVEREKVGGTCLHRGCIPAKEFLEAATVYRTVRHAGDFGIVPPTGGTPGSAGAGGDGAAPAGAPTIDFAVNQQRKVTVVDQLFRGLAGLLKGRKVETLNGTGTMEADRTVRVIDGEDAGRTLTATNVVLAAGSVPRSLPGLDIDGEIVVTSDEFLDLKRLPSSVVVVGGGVIGCEFASLLADLGSQVTIVEALDSILAGTDQDLVNVVARSFRKRGIEMITGITVTGCDRRSNPSSATLTLSDGRELTAEMVVVSVGRRPRTEDLVAEGSGVKIDERGFVVADRSQRTTVENVWAVGDIVAGTPQLAHVGFAEAIVAVKSMLGEPVVPVDYERVPWCIYCRPEVAFAGLTEQQARDRSLDIIVKKDPFGGNSRARIIGDTEGLVKVIAERLPEGTAGRLLGVHMVGPWVTEQLSGGYLGVNWEATPYEIGQFLQPHPSLSETFGETVLALTGRGLHLG